jgi:hypothetical protein
LNTIITQSIFHFTTTFNTSTFQPPTNITSFNMQFSMILAFAAAAVAAPAMSGLQQRQSVVCASGTPQCCATNVLNLADLNCANRTFSSPYTQMICGVANILLAPTEPTTNDEFIATCSALGQQAQCCILPILQQALFCTPVVPNAAAADPAAAQAATTA